MEKTSKNNENAQLGIGAVMAMLPTHGTHKTLGRIEILGVRVKSTKSNNLMYMTIIEGDMLWVYDYETELDFTKKDYDKKLLMDFTPKIYEWIMKPKFEDFDYGEGRKDLSWLQYAKALEEYVTFLEAQDPAFRQLLVSGSASDFEKELYKLINAYVSAGLKKPDLVHKMEYVTQSCRVS